MGFIDDIRRFYLNSENVCQYSGLVRLVSSDGGSMNCHRWILSARSKFFCEIMKENEEYEIPEVSKVDLEFLHKYLYTDLVDEKLLSFKMLTIANKCQVLSRCRLQQLLAMAIAAPTTNHHQLLPMAAAMARGCLGPMAPVAFALENCL